jgi:hypothetical protein
MERLEIGRRIGRGALLPTAVENAEPCAGQGAHRRLVCLALVALLLVLDVCPEGMPNRFRCPCDESLAEARRTLAAPMHPELRAAAFRHRRNARVFEVHLLLIEPAGTPNTGNRETAAARTFL